MTTAVRTPPHHNTLTCYADYRCRLPECVARMRAYEQRRRDAKAAGTWQPLVAAEPVRRHLLRLQAIGITSFRVATITGLPDRTIRGFTKRHSDGDRRLGLRQRTTPEIARAILAIDPATAVAAKVDATTSRRRVQALIAMGWPRLDIARRSGISYATLAGVCHHPLILASTAAAVADAYDALRSRRPTKYAVTSLQARKARTRGAANRWPLPAYWDDPDHPIEDPGFEPEYGVTELQILAEEAAWIMKVTGLTRAGVAKRLGKSHSYIDKALSTHPQDEQVAA